MWAGAGRHSQIPVQGTSMYPLLRPGDVALVVHGHDGLRVGDVAAYWSGDRIIVHRLLRRCRPGENLLTGGDNRHLADEPVPTNVVLGRVFAVHTPAGQFSLRSRRARLLGWTLATCFPLQSYRGLRRIVTWLFSLAAWILRP